MDSKILLRPYQKTIIEKVINRLSTDSTVVVGLAGGGGKSVIISELCRQFANEGKKQVVLTNISSLIPQLSKHLTEFGVKYQIIKSGHEYDSSINVDVYLIMEQSFHQNKRMELDIKCDILHKDEFHIGLGQKRYEDIVTHLEPSKVVGYTFTPLNELGYLLEGLEVDQVITDGNANDLTEQGYLVPIKYYVPKWAEDIDYSNVSASGNDYNGQEIDKIVSQDNHLEMIVDSMNRMDAKNKNVLVYASSIENANLINAKLNNNGYESYVKHSRTNESGQSNIDIALDDLMSLERPICIVSMSQLTIGFDYPKANLLVMLRPTKVKRLALQIFARVSRTCEGKDYAEILDLAQTVRLHGFLTDELKLVKYGDKKALEKSKQESSLEVSVLLNDNEPTEATRQLVLDRIEELRIQARTNLSLPEMIKMFEASMDFELLFDLSHKIYHRATGIEVSPKTTTWVFHKWDWCLDEYPEHKERWIKSFKSRIKNMVQATMRGEEKKFAGLFYFMDFLIDSKDKINEWHQSNR